MATRRCHVAMYTNKIHARCHVQCFVSVAHLMDREMPCHARQMRAGIRIGASRGLAHTRTQHDKANDSYPLDG